MLQKRRLPPLAGIAMLIAMQGPVAHADDVWSGQIQESVQKGGLSQKKEIGNWKFEVGGGAMYGTKYEGSDQYELRAVPQISAEYKEGLFFANPADGIGSYPLQGENYKVGASIGLDFGRSEDDSDDLRGMGDVDMSATANLMGEYDSGPIKFTAKVTKGNDDYGMTVEADMGTMFRATEKLMIMGKVGAKWADENNMATYFGVSPAQAARSGYAQYTADAGFKSVGVTVGGFYSISESWDVMLMVSADQLIGDAADSPLVKQKFQPMTMFSVGYKF
jgi:MipA family protein